MNKCHSNTELSSHEGTRCQFNGGTGVIKRVKTDGLDAKALCLKLDRFVQGNRAALAIVRVPSEAEEQKRAIHRQREQLVKARKQLEAQGRSLMVNHGLEPVQSWWKPRAFAALPVPQ